MKAIGAKVAAVVCVGVLALANYWIAQNPPASTPIEPITGQKVTSAASEAISLEIPSPPPELTHSLSQPLFLRNRRPWVAPPEPAPEQITAAEDPFEQPQPVDDPILLQLSLAGVQSGPDGKRALILAADQEEPRWVGPGETVGGWTVSTINAASVEIVGRGETRTVELYIQTSPDLLQ